MRVYQAPQTMQSPRLLAPKSDRMATALYSQQFQLRHMILHCALSFSNMIKYTRIYLDDGFYYKYKRLLFGCYKYYISWGFSWVK